MSSLDVFVDPASVAVVGASNDTTKWGHWLACGALAGRDRRTVHLVNRSGESVLDHRAHRSLSELPCVPDLVAVCVPAPFVASVVEEGLSLGVKGFLVITAGVPDQGRIATRVRASGARLIGPNSLGIFAADSKLRLAWGSFNAGPLAIVSQSGQVGSEIATLGQRVGLGVARFVSIGNQIDVTAADVLESLVGDLRTRVVAVYLESFIRGRELVEALQWLRDSGKSVIVLTTGSSRASRQLAATHTGSMTSGTDIVDAACRAAGALRVDTPGELVDTARLVAWGIRPTGRRVAIVSDSGGQGGIAADVAEAAGLEVVELSASVRERLRAVLPPAAGVANPIDLAGGGEADLTVYATVTQILAACGEVDAIVLSGYLGGYGVDNPATMNAELQAVELIAASARGAVPLMVHSMTASSPAVERFEDHRVPTFPTVERGLRALARAHELAAAAVRPLKIPVGGGLVAGAGYWRDRDALARVGIAFPAARRVTSRDEAEAAAAELRGPFVLKAGWLAHKSDHGGVALGLENATSVGAAFMAMHARCGDGEYVLEELDTRADVVEMLVGGGWDRDFGATVTVGAGGTQTELWSDIRTELAPVDPDTARAMIDSLTSARVLRGWRGAEPVDVEALVDTVVRVSEFTAAEGLAACELNPVRVGPDGAVAVDALIVSTRPEKESA